MVGESLLHQANHLLCDLIGCEACGGGKRTWPVFAKAATVVCIKIPLASNWLFPIHQDAGFEPEFAVEIFQPNLLAIGCMRCKIPHRAEKMRVITHL